MRGWFDWKEAFEALSEQRERYRFFPLFPYSAILKKKPNEPISVSSKQENNTIYMIIRCHGYISKSYTTVAIINCTVKYNIPQMDENIYLSLYVFLRVCSWKEGGRNIRAGEAPEHWKWRTMFLWVHATFARSDTIIFNTERIL